jgi:hypothetical protein
MGREEVMARKRNRRIVAALLAALALGAVVLFVARTAPAAASQMITWQSGGIDGSKLPRASIAPIDPGFTGGIPVMVEQATKPPAVFATPSLSSPKVGPNS